LAFLWRINSPGERCARITGQLLRVHCGRRVLGSATGTRSTEGYDDMGMDGRKLLPLKKVY
jgi:hypothetical protein